MKLRQNDISWREIDGEMVILDLASSTYLTSNPTGTLLLRELAEDRSHDELVDALAAACDVPREQAEEDVAAFLDLLRGRALLQP